MRKDRQGGRSDKDEGATRRKEQQGGRSDEEEGARRRTARRRNERRQESVLPSLKEALSIRLRRIADHLLFGDIYVASKGDCFPFTWVMKS